MGKKTGLLLGLGIGYVLGTKAGRERYEQIMNTTRKVTNNPKVQKARESAKSHTPMRGSKAKTQPNQHDVPLAPNLKRVDN